MQWQCTIKNLLDRPVLLRLNSGHNRHVGARAEASDILAVDIKDNAGLRRLAAKGVIRISEPREMRDGEAGAESAKEESSQGKKK